MLGAIATIVSGRPGKRTHLEQIFVQNGGAFCYEYLPYCPEGGLIEGATPECRGPAQALLYQKAQEALLLRALPLAEARLAGRGFPGTLGLLKNCRDAEGHVYGAQENFEASIARGGELAAFRAGLALLLPLLFLTKAVVWTVIVAVLAVSAVAALIALAILALPPLRRTSWGARLAALDEAKLEAAAGRLAYWLQRVLTWPLVWPFAMLISLVGFRRVRREMLAFLISRPALSGSGTTDLEGRFGLSEKGPAIRQLVRRSVLPEDRALFDTGNLIKQLLLPSSFGYAPMGGLFRERQRLQLGLADSNMAQEAEYLKLGSTSLVLDMIEHGFLRGAPRLSRPLAALKDFTGDPTLKVAAETDQGPKTALELQRVYLERAKAYIRESKAASLEAASVVRLWEELLSGLERGEWGGLVGRLDWVTKRYLLESCGTDGGGSFIKTIDLRYHELGEGYLARLEQSGQATRLVSPEEIERAIYEPPEGTAATLRGALIRRADSAVPLRLTWDSALIGGRLRGQVVSFRRPEGAEGADGSSPKRP